MGCLRWGPGTELCQRDKYERFTQHRFLLEAHFLKADKTYLLTRAIQMDTPARIRVCAPPPTPFTSHPLRARVVPRGTGGILSLQISLMPQTHGLDPRAAL